MVGTSALEEKLSLFADEADMNDWAEVVWGVLLIGLGFYQMHHPWAIPYLPDLWIKVASAAMLAIGAAMLVHGMMDMSVKAMRRSMVMLGLADDESETPDYGLIRDVILNPGDYKNLLLQAYNEAYADGVLTPEEFDDLNRLADAMGIPWSEQARMALNASIDSALKDGVVTPAERALIIGACERANLAERDVQIIMDALEDGIIDAREKRMLEEILATIGVTDEEE
jgi:tellurite resistance protein